MTARHDDLHLNDPEDRALYRQRVAVEYASMKLDAIRAEIDLPNATRQEAIRAIAEARLRAMGINYRPV